MIPTKLPYSEKAPGHFAEKSLRCPRDMPADQHFAGMLYKINYYYATFTLTM